MGGGVEVRCVDGWFGDWSERERRWVELLINMFSLTYYGLSSA